MRLILEILRYILPLPWRRLGPLGAACQPMACRLRRSHQHLNSPTIRSRCWQIFPHGACYIMMAKLLDYWPFVNGNSAETGGFHTTGLVMQSLDITDIFVPKRLRNKYIRLYFETPWRSCAHISYLISTTVAMVSIIVVWDRLVDKILMRIIFKAREHIERRTSIQHLPCQSSMSFSQ